MHYSLRTQLQQAFEALGAEPATPVVADIDSGFKQVFEGKPKEEGGEATEQVVEKGCGGKKKPKAEAKKDEYRSAACAFDLNPPAIKE
jgi:NAD(P)H-dependent FMN reductase